MQGGFSMNRALPAFIVFDAISKWEEGEAETKTPAMVSSFKISSIEVVPMTFLNFCGINFAF
ncbi:hypothetical protein TFKS16_0781 [Tannerella forsythia KS16]|uniref:Uncharacterized protein n=1 Tax=Tannerella forsythia (strain ATCC 43037 / JCM 10827 / CCUG 21028 A / KCTC 5666 / FDC 338) TaxID=203275 RepID=G8UL26_TANFA|nr:hypothetical protein BFO_1464 [Tannerella forsythia 92A2]BAR48868.1 hypothetical protein TF3313_1342 [Tannerella forsythia 3313]BAR51075.1 hypothetical protein TFKS16_0781 [Tannerella forsythia KS16]